MLKNQKVMIVHRILFCLLGILGAFAGFSQSIKAKTDTLHGIVIHRYQLIPNGGMYCEMESTIIIEQDTVPFIPQADFNVLMLEKYPSCQGEVGPLPDYYNNYIKDYKSWAYTYNLNNSEFNRHQNFFLGFPSVLSNSFFFLQNDTASIYSIYNIYGSIVHYSINDTLNIFNQHQDSSCLCTHHKIYNNDFAVLKEALELTPLDAKTINKLNMYMSGIVGIKMFYCE